MLGLLAAKPPVPDCRSSAGDDLARLVAPHPRLTATAEQQRLDDGVLLLTAIATASDEPKQIMRPDAIHHPNHARRGQIPIEPAAPAPLHLPRFRALALLRRLPSARVGWDVIQASENLHISRPDALQQDA